MGVRMEEVDEDCGLQGVDENFGVDETRSHETFGVEPVLAIQEPEEPSNNDGVSSSPL